MLHEEAEKETCHSQDFAFSVSVVFLVDMTRNDCGENTGLSSRKFEGMWSIVTGKVWRPVSKVCGHVESVDGSQRAGRK